MCRFAHGSQMTRLSQPCVQVTKKRLKVLWSNMCMRFSSTRACMLRLVADQAVRRALAAGSRCITVKRGSEVR
jgi:hypothetical protein